MEREGTGETGKADRASPGVRASGSDGLVVDHPHRRPSATLDEQPTGCRVGTLGGGRVIDQAWLIGHTASGFLELASGDPR